MYLFYGPAGQKNPRLGQLKRHVSPLGKCTVCQMASPALHLVTINVN